MSQSVRDHGAMKGCVRCGTELQGRRRRFCSIKCKQSDINHRLQFDGACQRCGYIRNPECAMTGDMVSAAVEVGLRRRYVRRAGAGAPVDGGA